jgi:hypothetical protein
VHEGKGEGAIVGAPQSSLPAFGLALLCALAAGCGGSNDDVSSEANEVIRNLKSLKPGEFLIQGQRREKFSGPYTFKPGGYLLRFRRLGDSGRLTVSLESQRGSKDSGYKLLVDTERAMGTRSVPAKGKRYVHIVSSADGYLLRFTPKGRATG